MTHTNLLGVNFEPGITRPTRALEVWERVWERASEQVFVGVSVILFLLSSAVTVLWCRSMPGMGGMPMPGGWKMSMAWMRMPGQTWIGGAASFLAMWVMMMAAMMLPSLTPMLRRYRESVSRTRDTPLGRLTTLAGAGYLFVWAVFGLVVFPIGVAVATVEMERPALARTVPLMTGAVVLIAGAFQFTKWKAHYLTCCREAPGRDVLPARAGAAWRLGLQFGVHCGLSCANLTAILLAVGIMDLRAMGVVTAAITAERLAPGGERVARAIGAVAVGAGLSLILRAARFG
jgi:predicted metal-binding membrane protein